MKYRSRASEHESVDVDDVDSDMDIDVDSKKDTIMVEKKYGYEMLIEHVDIEGADHYSLVNAKSSTWNQTIDDIEMILGVI